MGQMISVVFSFRNEVEVLPELLARTQAAVSRLPEAHELIFVDDDSHDGSLELLLARREQDARIKVLTMSRRFGVAECLLAGIAHASGDAVVYLDADLQDPPELIPTLVERWRSGADVVHTRRTSRQGEGAFKLAATRLAYRFINWLSTIDLPVECGDFKLISRRVGAELVALRESDPYVRGLVVWAGYRQDVVEYARQPRAGGLTHFPVLTSRNPTKAFVSGITSFSFAPVYAVLGAGLAGTALALAGLSLVVAGWVLARPPGGRTWLALALLLGWSTQLVAIGVVGIYVARSYKDVRQRPRWIVRDRYGLELPPSARA